MFWAAPLVSREYEAGTHRLAWTQTVSPLRWITVKIVLIFGALAGLALILGLLAAWTLDPLTAAFGGRYNSTWYDTQGLVPVACMLFALAVGVAASALIRRTIPAMAVTLIVYAAVRIPIHWIRGNFWPAVTHTYNVDVANAAAAPDRTVAGRVPLDIARPATGSRPSPSPTAPATATSRTSSVSMCSAATVLSVRTAATSEATPRRWIPPLSPPANPRSPA